jgi:hypothetical protein
MLNLYFDSISRDDICEYLFIFKIEDFSGTKLVRTTRMVMPQRKVSESKRVDARGCNATQMHTSLTAIKGDCAK